jgi:DNA-binding NtrC family response regulator
MRSLIFRCFAMPWRIQLLFRRYQTVNLLLIENYDPMARALRAGLEEEEFLVHTADDMIGVHRLAASEDFDIILLDLPPLAQLTALLDLRQAKIFTPVLLLPVRHAREAVPIRGPAWPPALPRPP